MSEKKPDWFEMAENDEKVAAPTKRFNSRPIIAFAVSGVIIGAGAILANADDESPVVAKTTNVQTSTTGVNDPAAPTGATTSGGIQDPTTRPPRGDDGDGEFGEHRGPRPGGHEFGERDREEREHEARFEDND